MAFYSKSFIAFTTCVVLGACADKGGFKIEQAPAPPGLPASLTGTASAGGTPIQAGSNVGSRQLQFTPEEDLEFTDPDNPDAGIPELETLMAAPKRGPWEESETIARQTAIREGRPILIWFTDTARSPTCKTLAAELFSTNEFGKWAERHIVRLRVNADIVVSDPNLTLDQKITRQTELKNYVQRLKKRYKVSGHPTLVMLNQKGEVLWKEIGYRKGRSDFIWGLIKQAAAVTANQHEAWRKSLESKGYRDWEGANGRKVFAKLVSYSNENLILIEPGGDRYKTNESRLSRKDKKWIAEQKALRGIE
jgi:thioredoxin-related protein